jgi:hypothetical protein
VSRERESRTIIILCGDKMPQNFDEKLLTFQSWYG